MPDEVLSKLGFGRAHHRVLHFVNRNPGMKVADLLDILNITKQSLGRVLKQMVDQGFVQQKEGAQDRRQRLLYVTPKGEALALKLAGLQTARITRAFGELGPGAHEAARRFLTAMIDTDNREGVLRLIARADRAAKPQRLGGCRSRHQRSSPRKRGPRSRTSFLCEGISDSRLRGNERRLDDDAARHASRRRAASAGGRRRPPHPRPAVALPCRRGLSREHGRDRGGRARQAQWPELRSAHPRRDDAGRDPASISPRRSAAIRACRS